MGVSWERYLCCPLSRMDMESTILCLLVDAEKPIEHSLDERVAVLCWCCTEKPQLVSKDDILWSMVAMQLREVGNLVTQLWKM